MKEPVAKIPFPFDDAGRAFRQSLGRYVQGLLEQVRSEIIAPENVQGYQHGIRWQSHHSDRPDDISELKQHVHELTVKSDQLISGELDVLAKEVKELTKAMHDGFMRSLYQVMAEGCDRVGNTVSAKGRPPSEAFLEMLQKIEFGVDKNGRPSLPQVHLGPAAFEAMMKDLESRGPDFKTMVDQVIAEKVARALEREKERVSKFVANDV